MRSVLKVVGLVAAVSSGCATLALTPSPQSATAATPAVPADLTPPTLRLPSTVRPLRYAVQLQVVPGADTFSGEVVIELRTTAEATVLWLNATALTVGRARLSGRGQTLELGARAFGGQFLALVPPRALPAGDWQLTLQYRGVISRNEQMGLFALNDGQRDYAMTRFESTGARRAVPCFDEPGIKVPWQLSVKVKADQLAVSNAPVVSQTVDGEWKTVAFAPSRPLPTSLWALAVGPWDVVDLGTAGLKHTPLRVLTPHGRAATVAWAGSQLGPMLDALEAYFGTPYPDEKLDQLAMPLSHGGALESLGLVTWGRDRIPSVPGQPTLRQRKAFHLTASRELAHLWFGELATMAWWDDLWLDESLAEWLMWHISSQLHPEWHLEADRLDELNQALGADGLSTARKLRQPVAAFDDIDWAFDGITSAKGAAVLTQFEAWLTPEVFQRGVRQYLSTHADGTAAAADFFAALSTAAGKDVEGPLRTFIDQPGAPRLEVALECPAAGLPALTVSQRRALPVGSKADPSPRWQAPFCVSHSSGRQCGVLTGERSRFPLEGVKACPGWVVPNEGLTGYARATATLPGKTLGQSLKVLASAKGPTSLERLGVVSSLGALVSSGELDVGDALDLAAQAMASRDGGQWARAAALAFTVSPLVPEPLRPSFERWVTVTFSPRLQQLGLTGQGTDDSQTIEARAALLRVCGLVGHDPELRIKAQALVSDWLARRASLSSESVDAMLALAVNGPDVGLKDRLVAAVKVEADPFERDRLLAALGHIDDDARLLPNLELVSGTQVAIRESVQLLFAAARWPDTREAVWTYVQQHFDQLAARLPSSDTGGPVSAAGLTRVVTGFCDQAHLDQARAFFGPKVGAFPGMARALEQAAEQVELCIAREARQRASLARSLSVRR